jgi:tellurite resistance protein TehA-like permease
MAVPVVGGRFLPQRRSVRLIRHRVGPPISHISTDVAHASETAESGRPSGCYTNGMSMILDCDRHADCDSGSRHDCQHDRTRLCTTLGEKHGVSGMGVCSIATTSDRALTLGRLWMLDAATSLVCALYLPYLLTIRGPGDKALSSITALHMFPIVTCVIASATSSIVASALPDDQQALVTIFAGYILWGVGMPTSLMFHFMYWHRLALHHLPPREIIVSSFIPLGPLGMGGYAAMNLGQAARDVFPRTETISLTAGELAYDLGAFVALILWGFCLVWLLVAVAAILSTRTFPFNMGWWG